ncbi:Lrp/AsnC family transcriptional regulator [Peterkaempfera sp. SMS 1(5)a]|uniref:Lrp/AsnC family transcriptional regulator n=1 Tax=Peterkaempfera podocarpi TaxID=3232308 RepID=UPI00366B0E8A
MVHDSVDEADLELIHALQVDPRATWTTLGKVLRAAPVTVARRWQRLQNSGLAWVTCVAGPAAHGDFCMAYAEIACHPGRLAEVSSALAAEPAVRYVHHLTGDHGLLVVFALPSPAAVSDHVHALLDPLPGVRDYRLQIRTTGFREPSRWRLRSLEPAQESELRPTGPEDTARASVRLQPGDQVLYRLLHEDGRMPFAELAERAGISEPTARRRVRRLLDDRVLRLRCEVAQSVSGWPATSVLWATAPAGHLDAVGRALALLPEVRLCCALTGPRNLLVMVWLRNVGELPAFEAAVSRRFQALTVVDRAVCLHTTKQMGRLLDSAGRSIGLVEPGSFFHAGP